MATILVTGANGQLGNELRTLAANLSHRFIFTDITAQEGVQTTCLDITDEDAVLKMMKESGADVVVNCAAYTNVDKAEEDGAAANLLNHLAPGILAQAAAKCGARIIHISTDYVFDGKACVPYTEECSPSPVSVYGITKLAGEKAVIESGASYVIFRTAWLYSPYGRNFVKTMMALTSQKPSIKVVSDQVGSPTYAADLAQIIVKAIDRPDVQGLFHFTDEGVTSWYDFSCAIAQMCGNTSCEIHPCRSGEYPVKAERPHFSVLDKTKVMETFKESIPHWRDSLAKCIDILKNQ